MLVDGSDVEGSDGDSFVNENQEVGTVNDLLGRVVVKVRAGLVGNTAVVAGDV